MYNDLVPFVPVLSPFRLPSLYSPKPRAIKLTSAGLMVTVYSAKSCCSSPTTRPKRVCTSARSQRPSLAMRRTRFCAFLFLLSSPKLFAFLHPSTSPKSEAHLAQCADLEIDSLFPLVHREAIEELIEQGHVYSTIDDEHILATS